MSRAPSRRDNSDRSVRRDLVENEIYDHAARLFAERGFAGTSLQDVADAMGLTRSALYYYVKNKDELLARLVSEITEVPATALCRHSTSSATSATARPTSSSAYSPPFTSASGRATGRSSTRAIVDGVASLSHFLWALHGAGAWSDTREANLLDGGTDAS